MGVTRWEGGRLVLIPYLPGVWDGPSWRSGLDVNENYNKSKTVKYYRVGGSGTNSRSNFSWSFIHYRTVTPS